MDTARSDAVLIAFGSVAKNVLMTDYQKKAFCEAFGAFPEVVLLKKASPGGYKQTISILCAARGKRGRYEMDGH